MGICLSILAGCAHSASNFLHSVRPGQGQEAAVQPCPLRYQPDGLYLSRRHTYCRAGNDSEPMDSRTGMGMLLNRGYLGPLLRT